LHVQKGWSILFAGVMFACGALWVASAFVPSWWLPPVKSTHGPDIDRLYFIILGITGFFFILTETLLVVFMWKYAGRPHGQHVFGHHAKEKKVFWLFRPVSAILHNQHRVELAWTLVPAVILLYIAFAQVGTWAEAKYKSRMPVAEKKDAVVNPEGAVPVRAEISARQFEWRIRYPGLETWRNWQNDPGTAKPWEKLAYRRQPQQDDVHVVNELHIIKGRPVVVYMSTLDVIHSFNVPHMRVKQDALPGRVIPVWFVPTESNTARITDKETGLPRWVDGGGIDAKGQPKDVGKVWEIACAELCGWGHYRMIGKVFVHPDAADFEAWLEHAEKENNRHVYKAKTSATR
jgi:cytochrome c oxidase subunit 2